MGDYLKTTLDDPGNNHLCKTDDIWMELIKTSLLNFFRVLLPLIDKLEEEKIKELEYISQFESGDIHTKRMMWRDIQAYIKRNYSYNCCHRVSLTERIYSETSHLGNRKRKVVISG